MIITVPHHALVVPAQLDLRCMEEFDANLVSGISTGLPLLLHGSARGEFCRGLDLEHQQVDLARAQDFAGLLIRIWQAPVPTIALVDGPAIGGGLGLAAACDRVISTPDATFALPELLWGFVPAMIWPLITMRMRDTNARWWIITGRARSAEEAAAAGIVDEVVEPTHIARTVNRCLKECGRADAAAIPLLRQLAGPDVVQRIAAGAAMTAEQLATTRVQQRLAAYARGDVPW